MKTKYNPERRVWRGRSYKKGGQRVMKLREASNAQAEPAGRIVFDQDIDHWAGRRTSASDAPGLIGWLPTGFT